MPNITLLTKEQGLNMVQASLPANNEIIYDSTNNPSVMVKIPKFRYCDLFEGGSDATHPAFIVGAKEVDYIYISKYLNIVIDNKAYSLPNQVPENSITYDNAITCCENKGPGWHLMSNAEWAAVALWAKRHETEPFGNNNNGYDYYHSYDNGIIKKIGTESTVNYTLTGSGFKDWYHNHDYSGIADLNGNVSEWVSGIRLNNGEIQIIKNNDVALQVNQSSTSDKWQAVLQDGTLCTPGTSNTLKYTADGKISTGSAGTMNSTFKTITNASGITIPEILKGLGLHPAGIASTYKDDSFSVITGTDILCRRGGDNTDGNDAGIFACNFEYLRSSCIGAGFRAAYVDTTI